MSRLAMMRGGSFFAWGSGLASKSVRRSIAGAGANYDPHAPSAAAVRPVGEWNEVRLIVNNGHVQQWLNGQLVVEYDLWTPEWEALVAGSKVAEMPDYGRARSGRIALQDHGGFRALVARAPE